MDEEEDINPVSGAGALAAAVDVNEQEESIRSRDIPPKIVLFVVRKPRRTLFLKIVGGVEVKEFVALYSWYSLP